MCPGWLRRLEAGPVADALPFLVVNQLDGHRLARHAMPVGLVSDQVIEGPAARLPERPAPSLRSRFEPPGMA